MKKPNFFIIGAPKCGTTSLAFWLGEHPQVFMPRIKEPNYYSTDLKNRRVQTINEYQRFFNKATEMHSAVGEASVYYLYSLEAVSNILIEIPDAKFIVCLRNPVDMAYSLHGQQVFAAYEHVRNFQQAWELQAKRAEGLEVTRFCDDSKLLLYGPICLLGEQLQRLYGIVPRTQVLPLLLDDMKLDPRSVYLKVLRFLDVPDDGKKEFPVHNVAKERGLPVFYKAMRIIYKIRRKVGIPRFGTGIMAIFSKINKKKSSRQMLTSSARAELYEYFKSDIDLLENLLSQDLSSWKK
jgi:hypothetical protein